MEVFPITSWVVNPKLQALIVVSFVTCHILTSCFVLFLRQFSALLFCHFSVLWKPRTNILVSFFFTIFLREIKSSFAPTKWPVKNRHMLTKRNSQDKVFLTVLCMKKKCTLGSSFLIDMPLYVAILFAKAIADNVWTNELLGKWIFYNILSTEFSKLWDQMGKNLFLSKSSFKKTTRMLSRL